MTFKQNQIYNITLTRHKIEMSEIGLINLDIEKKKSKFSINSLSLP